VDSTKENISDPYTVEVSASAPQGHIVNFTLIAQDGAFSDTFAFTCVIGTYHYLVWNPDPTAAPGQAIHSILGSMGYSGLYSTTLPTTDLGMYLAIFGCMGIYPNNHMILANSAEATALTSYCNSGGRLYLEGGDFWYYDPLVGGHDFCPLFGITATADGTTDMGPVAGQAGTFTNGMNFNYSGENSYMDHISPSGSGAFLIFRDTDNAYDCGVARDAGTYRTVGTSFELGALVDGSGVSTRAALLDSILHFFGVILTAVEETDGSTAKDAEFGLHVHPSIATREVRIAYNVGQNAKDAVLRVYDATGRLVKSFTLCPLHSALCLTWNATDDLGLKAAPGIYFVKLEAGNANLTEKIILVR
jgi:hypothetical protein